MTNTAQPNAPASAGRHTSDPRFLAQITKALERRSFATLATASPAQRPHVVAVLYQAVGQTLYVTVHRDSRKARNLADNPYVAVCVPVRRLPIGPAAAIQFQGTAELLTKDDPEIARLLGAGRLKRIVAHGELDDPDTCFVRIRPGRRLHTYGLGMSLLEVLRDPLNANRTVELPDPS
jgi:general stress protein 26